MDCMCIFRSHTIKTYTSKSEGQSLDHAQVFYIVRRTISAMRMSRLHTTVLDADAVFAVWLLEIDGLEAHKQSVTLT